jgi:hypothetical protein
LKLLEEYKDFKIYKTFSYVFNYKYEQLPNKNIYVAENKINHFFIEHEDIICLKHKIDVLIRFRRRYKAFLL